MLTLPPLSLYIHLPWCVRKCPYCDFNSHRQPDELPESAYVDALLEDLQQDLAWVQGRTLHSIFIGGGTPSLFSAKALERLLMGVRSVLPYDDIEITLEANPGTVERGLFAEYRQIGINRISLGVQSFSPECLTALGRIHSCDEAITAVEEIITAGFSEFNIDLMHGLPNQTQEMALSDVRQALVLQPTHLSWYQLTIEPNTAFALRPPTLPGESTLEAIESQGLADIAAHGLKRYEVSAFARDHSQCQHNLNYWQFGDYLAIGAGAHGKVTDLQSGSIRRYWKHRHPKQYLSSKQFIGGQRVLVSEELPLEFMMNACRLYQPIEWGMFEQRTGLSRTTLASGVQRAQQKGLLMGNEDAIELTDVGRQYLNEVLLCFSG